MNALEIVALLNRHIAEGRGEEPLAQINTQHGYVVFASAKANVLSDTQESAVELSINENNPNATALAKRFFDALGYYPLIYIDEYNIDQNSTYDRYHGYIDTAKLPLIDDHSLGYVEQLIEVAAREAGRKQSRAFTLTSNKYSFGDTSDWWKNAEVADRKGREVINLEIEIN